MGDHREISSRSSDSNITVSQWLWNYFCNYKLNAIKIQDNNILITLIIHRETGGIEYYIRLHQDGFTFAIGDKF